MHVAIALMLWAPASSSSPASTWSSSGYRCAEHVPT